MGAHALQAGRLLNLTLVNRFTIQIHSQQFRGGTLLVLNMENASSDADINGLALTESATLATGILACLLSSLGISGNLVTVISLVRDKKLRSQATSVFVISLAISDLLFCSINLPLTAVRYFQRAWTLGPLLCRLYPFFFYGNYAASLISMVSDAKHPSLS